METVDEGSCVKSHVEGPILNVSDPIIEAKSEPTEGGIGCVAKVKEEILDLDGGNELGFSIEEDMRRVNLVSGLSPFVGDRVVVMNEVVNCVEMEENNFPQAQSSVDPNGSTVNSENKSDEKTLVDIGLVDGLSSVTGDGRDVDSEVISDGGDSESECDSDSESDSSSSSSSSNSGNSSDDNDEDDDESSSDEEGVKERKEKTRMERDREVTGVCDIEEGEIRELNDSEEDNADNMVDWNDAEFDEVDVEDDSEPVKSKNELKVLPPVPQVDVILQPHHQMLPVGAVLSIVGAQVIVEGTEKHNPLNEGSILWVTETRSPLGLVDEIFGPVKNPYYMVRYNSESEVPIGIHGGSLISFVPEFASHVLNDKNLYRKGCDASGEHDEEVSDEAEFSDDEEEAEYRKMLKMSKRGMNDQAGGSKKNNRRRTKNRDANWKNNNPPSQQPMSMVHPPSNQNRPNPSSQQPMIMVHPPSNQNRPNISPVRASANLGAYSASGQNFVTGAGFAPNLPPMPQTAAMFQPSNGIWVNGAPSQLPLGFPVNNMPWPVQNQLQHPHQMAFPMGIPIQQFNPRLPNAVLSGGQPVLSSGPAHQSWPGFLGQSPFNQTMFGMGFQVQPTHPPMDTVNAEQNPNLEQPGNIPSNIQTQHFNRGASGSRGRRPHQRGGGRFAGGRGRRPSK